LLYTPDGELFRSIGASSIVGGQDADLETGIKLCRLSPDASLCAVGDHSRTVGVLNTQTWRDCLKLVHPTTIVPKDTLQVRDDFEIDAKLPSCIPDKVYFRSGRNSSIPLPWVAPLTRSFELLR
jgi:hypothetical protein